MKIKLFKSKPEFQVMIHTANTVNNRATAVKIKIEKAVLYVRRIKATASKIREIESQLETQNAISPIQKSKMVTFTIPSNS